MKSNLILASRSLSWQWIWKQAIQQKISILLPIFYNSLPLNEIL